MSDAIWFRTGEATVFSSEGQGTDAMPEILIGSVKGPAGNAFATLMGQTEGHTRMFAIPRLQPARAPRYADGSESHH